MVATVKSLESSARRRLGGQAGILYTLLALIAAAWGLCLYADLSGTASQSAFWEMLGGHDMTHDMAGMRLSSWSALAVVLAAWVVMTTAMMLPSSVGMIYVFTRSARAVPSWRRAVTAFILPYLVVWCAFGAVGFAAESGLNAAMMRWPWLTGNAGILLALALALAAAWQLTPLKDACLRQCRSPVSFMVRYYRRGTGAALQLGFRHALFCFGCCWALMLVAVVAGMQYLWLMGMFAVVMFAEKSLRWGPRIVRPVGTICGATAALVLLWPLLSRA